MECMCVSEHINTYSMCVSACICLDCVCACVSGFSSAERLVLCPSPPLSSPHINYIRPVIYGQITGCKMHYFLMETGPRRDPSACITVGLGLTASYVSMRLTRHNQRNLSSCAWYGFKTILTRIKWQHWFSKCLNTPGISWLLSLRAEGEPLNLLFWRLLGQQRKWFWHSSSGETNYFLRGGRAETSVYFGSMLAWTRVILSVLNVSFI